MLMHDAEVFFEQLGAFSQKYFESIGYAWTESLWGRSKWEDRPRGAIIHYTADTSLKRTVLWFMRPDYQSFASAHVVVADRRLPECEALLEGFPLVQQLPVTVVQCRSPERPASHATWANRICYGIENVNAGLLPDGVESTFNGKTPVEVMGRKWEPYTQAQIQANIFILRQLNMLLAGTLERPWILGHESVQGEHTKGASKKPKWDPGPLFPIHDVREKVFEEAPELDLTPYYGECVEMYPLGAIGRDSREELAEDAFSELPDRVPGDDNAMKVRSQVRRSLERLGYYVRATKGNAPLNEEEALSLWIFQRMRGLVTDGIAGPKTMAAFEDELRLKSHR